MPGLSRTFALSRRRAAATILIAMASAASAAAEHRVQIDAVNPEFRPTMGPQSPEPVSMQHYSFQIEPEMGRARVVVEYTYPSQIRLGLEAGAVLEPTVAQIPGLRYDKMARKVVYENAGTRVACATVHQKGLLFWRRSSIELTGACKVSAQLLETVDDDGWSMRRNRSLQVFFEAD